MRAVLVLSFVACALACDPPSVAPAYAPTLAFARCPTDSPMGGLVVEGQGAECATLDVPLDWRDPASPMLTLDVARVKAAGERVGVLTFDFGGPGIPAIVRLGALGGRAGLAGEALDLVDRFDRVALDRRGTGLGCVDRGLEVTLAHTPRAPSDGDEWLDVFDVERAIAVRCQERAGDVLPFLDVESAARDLDALRVALGEDALTLLASSEGTRTAAAYATLFPEHTRAVVLDSPALANDDAARHLREQALAFENALDRFFLWCADQTLEVCPLHLAGESGPDVADVFDDVVALLDVFPVQVNGLRVDGGFVTDLVVDASFAPDRMWEALGVVLGRARNGDWDGIARLAGRVDPDVDEGAFRAITAIDRPLLLDEDGLRALADELSESAPRVGARTVRGEVGNALWPARAAQAPMVIGPTRAPPFLILTARFDGATPMTWAQEMRDVLGNDSAIVVYEGDGHTRAPDVECLGRAAVAHLLDPAARPPSTCAAIDP